MKSLTEFIYESKYPKTGNELCDKIVDKLKRSNVNIDIDTDNKYVVFSLFGNTSKANQYIKTINDIMNKDYKINSFDSNGKGFAYNGRESCYIGWYNLDNNEIYRDKEFLEESMK